MHSWLTNNFWHDNVAKVIRFNWLTLVVFQVLKNVEGQAFVLLKRFVDEEAIFLVSMRELDDLFAGLINMRCVIIAFLDLLLW